MQLIADMDSELRTHQRLRDALLIAVKAGISEKTCSVIPFGIPGSFQLESPIGGTLVPTLRCRQNRNPTRTANRAPHRIGINFIIPSLFQIMGR